MAKHRKKYTEEFKRDAVRMMRNRGERTVAQVADDLGVQPNQLHRWASNSDHTATAKRNDSWPSPSVTVVSRTGQRAG